MCLPGLGVQTVQSIRLLGQDFGHKSQQRQKATAKAKADAKAKYRGTAKGFEHFTKQNAKKMLWVSSNLQSKIQRKC